MNDFVDFEGVAGATPQKATKSPELKLVLIFYIYFYIHMDPKQVVDQSMNPIVKTPKKPPKKSIKQIFIIKKNAR